MAERAVQFEAVDFDPFASGDGSNILPLSATQRELLAAVQMGPQAHCAFNLVYVLHLRGPLAIDSLRAALATVVQRHAALRTVLAADGASQQVLGTVPVDIPQHELAGLSPPDCEAALAEAVEYETHTPFDLARAPLWRARVLSHPDGLHWLVFNVHHWACDGWSSTVLFGDWAAAYGADRLGLAAPLPTALPYDELVLALESPMVRAQSQDDEAYWRAQHTPPAEPLNLPLERSRPLLKTYACGVETLALDAGTTAAVRSLGARQGCTFFVTMLAVCQGLLARLSGQSDIVLGVPMAYQTHVDSGHVVAHGAHTVPLRVAVDLRAPFSDQLRCSRRTFLDAQAHQLLTFGNLVHSLGLPRDPSRTPLVDIVFNIDRIGAPFHFSGLTLERVETPKAFSNHELSINVIDRGHDAVVECHYNLAILDGATVKRWLNLYAEGLTRLTADGSLALDDAFAPTAADAQLLDRFNATQVDGEPQDRIEELFALQVAATPDAPALWSDQDNWSYAELDAAANGVAQSLRSRGVRGGERVGLACERHPLMVAGLIGILKAGAAYVPLDPGYPAERLALMVDDAQLALVVGDTASLRLPAFERAQQLDLASCEAAWTAPPPAGQPSRWAYVMYTSGSTGKPKGVTVPHGGLVNYIASVRREPGMSAADRCAAVTTLSFDISLMDPVLAAVHGRKHRRRAAQRSPGRAGADQAAERQRCHGNASCPGGLATAGRRRLERRSRVPGVHPAARP